MFKKLFLLLLGFMALGVVAQVSVISVTDEDKHSSKEDFYHTFEYYISSGKQSAKCQATRVGKRWFATAAHCVNTLCKNKCTLQMDLLEQDISVLAAVYHSAKKPAVFVHPEYSDDVFAKDDFALIQLDLRRAPLTYYMRTKDSNAPNIVLSKDRFDAFLEKNRKVKSQYARVLSPTFPPLLVFDEGDYLLDRKLSVISIFNGKREVKVNPHEVYYLKALGYAFTNNFGIRKGMSGSGVMTNTGELAGIISANMDIWFQKGKEKETYDYFIFPVFNKSLLSFMQSTMGGDFYQIEQKDAYPYAVRKTRKNFSSLLPTLKKVSQKKGS